MRINLGVKHLIAILVFLLPICYNTLANKREGYSIKPERKLK